MASDTFVQSGHRSGEWDLSQGCENPIPVELYSNQTGEAKNLRNAGYRPLGISLALKTRCRKCGWCLARKSWEWATRAESEIEQSQRTWFGTLTLRPDEHVRLEWLGVSRNRKFGNAASAPKFEHTATEIGREVTLFFKRLRKNNPGCRIRYLCVTEVHDGENTSPEMRGRIHLHLLVHEGQGQLISKRSLERGWNLGFQQWKLCEKGAGWYVSKYVSKATHARVRASVGYGKQFP